MDYIYSATKKPCPDYIFQNILIGHVVKIKSVTPIFLYPWIPMYNNILRFGYSGVLTANINLMLLSG